MNVLAEPEQLEKFKEIDKYYDTALPLNDFLFKQNGFIDADCICPNVSCKKKGSKFKTTTLIMIPEILTVVLKKYKYKLLTPFPAKLEFLAKGGTKKLIYILVAQSEHSGGMSGGHYWAICLRKSDNTINSKMVWKTLNDSSVSDGTPGPTINSYILFYNFLKIENVSK